MARKKKFKIPPSAVKIAAVCIGAIITGVILWKVIYGGLTNSEYFQVKTIIIDPSLQFIDKKNLVRLKGKNIFTINLKSTQARIARRYPQISDLKVVRRLPNQIMLLAKKRYPFAQVKVKGKILTLDDRSIVLSVSNKIDRSLPFISKFKPSSKNYALGVSIRGPGLSEVMKLLTAFKNTQALSSYKLESVDLENTSKINMILRNRLKVIVDQDKINRKMKILGVILTQGNLDLKEVKYIDLRFKEPIIGKK